jgi:hypothetical protein
LTFVNEQCNASRAPTRLCTHRNTLLRQLSRADQLLLQPLGDNSVNVAVALDVLHWRGEAGLDHGAHHFRAHVAGVASLVQHRDYVPLFIER